MADTPPRQVQPQVDAGSADMCSLRAERPVPQYRGLFLEPDLPPADEPE
ncbi:hypothetical protein ACFYX8_35020 [Streptomyces cyaneofuscatus]